MLTISWKNGRVVVFRLCIALVIGTMLYVIFSSRPDTLKEAVKSVFVPVSRRSQASKCLSSPYVECPDSRQVFSSVYFVELFHNTTGAEGYGGGGAMDRPHPGLWKIAGKLRRGEPVVISLLHESPGFVFPPPDLACLRNSCVYRQGQVSEEVDVVVARGVDLGSSVVPARRWSGQLYLLDELESPMNFYLPNVETNGSSKSGDNGWRFAFNLTSTYSPASDIFHPYNTLVYSPIPANIRPNYTEIAKRKTKNVLWLVSNCYSSSHREQYVDEMKKYIDVDTYGGCGESTGCQGQRVPCLRELFKPYRFYLAFENSLCDDYITEKFFKLYDPYLYTVPVTLGKGQYSRYIPPGTFVDSSKFPSPKQLSLHLLRLAENVTVFALYLEAKDEYRAKDSPDQFCNLCSAFRSLRLRPKRYDLMNWVSEQCNFP